MDHDDDFYETPELPEPDPGNTLEAVEELNQEVNQHIDVLEDELEEVDENQEHQWINRLRAVKPKNTADEYIIGIIGATGVGKSALMNAMLGEDFLLPTSCMQACTAAIIEVAYNRSALYEYRAIIEFVSRDKWHEEIRKLFRLTSDSLEDLDDDTSEAAIVFAKLSAVYTDLNRESLSTITENDLISCPGLEFLGTIRKIYAPNALVMNTKLQQYIETKERAEASPDHHQEISPDTLQQAEYWPLVRKVRIFVKAPVLRTGIVLTDLPGVADANPARSSIAMNYLPNCTSIWVVTPVLRAIDDKIAHDLGSENLKRQLRRDGILDRVVFICSKADQLSIPELKRKFKSDINFTARMRKIDARKQDLMNKKKEVKKDIARLEKILESAANQIRSLDPKNDGYAQHLQMANGSRSARPSVLQSLKRGSMMKESPSPKRPRLDALVLYDPVRSRREDGRVDSIDLELDDVYDEEDPSTSNVEQGIIQPPTMPMEVQTKSDKNKKTLDELRTKRKDQKINLHSQKRKLECLETSISSVATQEWEECYTARNEYVSKHLRSDFQLGIRELERAETKADDHFDPSEEASGNFE